MTPRQALEQRFIYEQSLLAGWRETKDYWEYDLYSPDGKVIATRQKKYPFSEIKGKKYLWKGEKPANPDSDWYILPDTLDAIRQANGVVWLANGEPALLAYKRAGIHNVIATPLAEIAVPKNAATYLQAIGANRILYPVDKDEAGLKSAQNWHDALIGKGADFQAFQWPNDMPEKADANDVLIAVAGDKQAFQAILNNLSPITLETTIKANKPKAQVDYSEVNSKLVHDLIETLSVKGYLSGKKFPSGFLQMRCIHHDDHDESAGISPETGVINCFKCGSHSLKQSAIAIGLDYASYFPKTEKQKRAKTRDKSDFSQVPSGNVPTDDFITMAFDSFSEIIPMSAYDNPLFWIANRHGWVDQDELPTSWIRAMFHLTHSKSATVIIAIKLHRAIRQGLLNADGFTIADTLKVLGGSRPSTQGAFDTFAFWQLLTILDTKYLDTKDIVLAKSLKNRRGRKAIVYAVNPNTDAIIDSLISLLEPALLERLTEDEIAPINSTMRDSLDLDFAEWKAWHEKTTSPKQQHILDSINKMLCEVLESRASYSFSDEDLQSPGHLRAKLLNVELAPYSERQYTDTTTGEIVTLPREGIQLSRAKLALLLGCSPSAMTKLYELANVGSERKRGWYEVENPNGCDILKELREAPLNLSKELSGVALGANIKVMDNGKERFLGLAYSDRAINLFNAWNGHITKLYIFVEQPSLLWNMTETEIAQKAAKEAELEQQALDSAESPEERAVVEDAIEKKAAAKQRKPRFVSGKDRLYKGHAWDWMNDKVGAWVHCYTWHKLEGLSIVDTQETVLASFKALAEVVVWLNRHAEPRQVRTIESYYKPIIEVEEIEAPELPAPPVMEYSELPKPAPRLISETVGEWQTKPYEKGVVTRWTHIIEKMHALDERIAKAKP